MPIRSFDIVRTINAPIEAVFARLADINGHNDWLSRKVFWLGTEQTSAGEATVGTTYTDKSRMGPMNGEIAEFDPPTRLDYHWWDGDPAHPKSEGWPRYSLEAVDANTTKVTHSPEFTNYGMARAMTPMFAVMARLERHRVMNALVKSFEDSSG